MLLVCVVVLFWGYLRVFPIVLSTGKVYIVFMGVIEEASEVLRCRPHEVPRVLRRMKRELQTNLLLMCESAEQLYWLGQMYDAVRTMEQIVECAPSWWFKK